MFSEKVRKYGSPDAAITQIIQNWNSASKIYEDAFNIALGIISIKIYTLCNDPPWNQDCRRDYGLQKRLSDFSKWRGTLGSDNAGLWHLMSDCPGSEGNIGSAWIGLLCASQSFEQVRGGESEYVSGTGVSTAGRNEWKVIAHEIGHSKWCFF